jgi:hypothetical protein
VSGERPAVAPPASATVASPQGCSSRGTFVRPPDAVALLALAHAIDRASVAVDPTTLPALLLRAANDGVTGRLTLERADGSAVGLFIEAGDAVVSTWEHRTLVDAFGWPAGTHRFEPGAARKRSRSDPAPTPMIELVVEGMRLLTRTYDVEEIERALGDRLDLAPTLSADGADIALRLGLTGLETRLVDLGFDGRERGRALLAPGSVGRQATCGLLVLLTMFGALAWTEVADELVGRASAAPQGPATLRSRSR